jgi:CheY-like chemotaxis protein
MDSDKERCLDSGMDDFLTKPLRMDKLTEIMNKYLAGMKVED